MPPTRTPLWLIVAALALATTAPLARAVVYVNAAATGGNNGTD